MNEKLMNVAGLTAVLTLVVATAGCGEFSRTGRAPAMAVILNLEGASGASPEEFSGTMQSDVVTIVGVTPPGGTTEVAVPTTFNDIGRVTMRLILKDQGIPGIGAAPTVLNQITINRYRVVYRRSDGRNVPGVDVPYPIDSATTFTVLADASVSQVFEIVRHTAKHESPLAALANSGVIISTVADITFYGRDLAGNDVASTGSIGIAFGNFGDPE